MYLLEMMMLPRFVHHGKSSFQVKGLMFTQFVVVVCNTKGEICYIEKANNGERGSVIQGRRRVHPGGSGGGIVKFTG